MIHRRAVERMNDAVQVDTDGVQHSTVQHETASIGRRADRVARAPCISRVPTEMDKKRIDVENLPLNCQSRSYSWTA